MADPIIDSSQDSILEQVKKILGMPQEQTAFDIDIILHINSVFSNMTQMGIGPVDGFAIDGYDQTWDEFVMLSSKLKTNQVKSYLPLKVRMLFDPPVNANVSRALKENITEMEFRLYIEEENTTLPDPVVEEEAE